MQGEKRLSRAIMRETGTEKGGLDARLKEHNPVFNLSHWPPM